MPDLESSDEEPQEREPTDEELLEPLESDDEPMMLWDPDDQEVVAQNDEWAYQRAERQVQKIKGRIGHDRRTEGEVFDRSTLMTLHRLLSHGVLRSLDFPVSTGKEANVFRGTTPEGGLVAVKIYRINTATFKHVLKYIQGDERFAAVAGDKKTLVQAWAQKEFRNLHRLRDAGVWVPEPVKVLNNVLVMEFLGTKDGPWPRLKEMGRFEGAQAAWDGLVEQYVLAYNHARLVHADLSEYNILAEGAGGDAMRPRIIDVGQAVLRNHPMAWEFLERDVRNLSAFFGRLQVKADPKDILDRLDFGDSDGGEEE